LISLWETVLWWHITAHSSSGASR